MLFTTILKFNTFCVLLDFLQFYSLFEVLYIYKNIPESLGNLCVYIYMYVLGNGKKKCWFWAWVRWCGEHSAFLLSSVALDRQFYFHESIAEIDSLVSLRDEVINNNFFERIPTHCMNYSGRRLSNYSSNRSFMIRIEKDQGNFTTCSNLTQIIPLEISFWLDF